MKTFRPLLTILFGLSAVLALQAARPSKPKPAPRTEVIFQDPDKFTEVKDRDFGTTDSTRDGILDMIREYIVDRADATLPPGQKLKMTFTDIDLAGEYEPWLGPRFSDVRIVKSIYPPSLKFSYTVTDEAGQVIKSGNESIRDTGFDMRITADRQDLLRYEKEMLNDWIRAKLSEPKK